MANAWFDAQNGYICEGTCVACEPASHKYQSKTDGAVSNLPESVLNKFGVRMLKVWKWNFGHQVKKSPNYNWWVWPWPEKGKKMKFSTSLQPSSHFCFLYFWELWLNGCPTDMNWAVGWCEVSTVQYSGMEVCVCVCVVIAWWQSRVSVAGRDRRTQQVDRRVCYWCHQPTGLSWPSTAETRQAWLDLHSGSLSHICSVCHCC